MVERGRQARSVQIFRRRDEIRARFTLYIYLLQGSGAQAPYSPGSSSSHRDPLSRIPSAPPRGPAAEAFLMPHGRVRGGGDPGPPPGEESEGSILRLDKNGSGDALQKYC